MTEAKEMRADRMPFPELVAFAAAVMALSALSIDIMLPAQTELGVDLNTQHANDGQMLVFVFMLGYGLAHIVFGPLSDRVGRRAVVLGALAAYCIASALAAWSSSFTLLLAARALQGASAAASRVSIMAMVRDLYSGRKMAEVASVVSVVFMAAPILAPWLGQLILQFAPWRMIFIALFVYGIVITIWTIFRMGETLNPDARRRFSFGSAASAYLEFAANRASCGYTLVTAALFGAFFAYLGTAQQIYAVQFEMGDKFPFFFAAGAVPFAISSILNARYVQRLGMRRIAHSALIALIFVGAAHLAFTVLFVETVFSYYGFMAATLFLLGFVGPNATALAMEPMGKIAGAAAAANGFASTTIAALIGATIGRFYAGSTTPIAAGFTIVSVAALLIALYVERGKLFGGHSAASA